MELGAIGYQWQRDGVRCGRGDRRPTYTLGNADVGHSSIDVVAKYTDGHGTAESVTECGDVVG